MDDIPQGNGGAQESGADNFRGEKNEVGNKKRKRDNSKDHYFNTYQNVTYERIVEEEKEIAIPSSTSNFSPYNLRSTAPGTFSRYFAKSYRAKFKTTTTDHDQRSEERQQQLSPKQFALQQIVHQHVNGLCVITIGDGNIFSSATTTIQLESIEKIEFLVTASERCSAGERRKRNSKMLKKGTANTVKSIQNKNQQINDDANNQHGTNATDAAASGVTSSTGIVKPDTMIAKLHLNNNGTFIPVFACVWGSILELNTSVTPKQLLEEPLLEGYLAVILPTGPFPPKERLIHSADDVVDTAV